MIITSSLLALVLGTPDVKSITLERGSVISGLKDQKQRYWDVTEGEIDATAPNLPIPTPFGLTGDKKRNIFIRFGSLDLFLGKTISIKEGTLTLSLIDPKLVAFKSISIVKRPWMIAEVFVLSKRNQAAKAPKTPATEPVFSPGFTWNRAGGDVAPWQSPGATGAEDSTIVSDAKATISNDKLIISGLGRSVEAMRKNDGANYGFMLQFESTTGIWGSSAPELRPRLELLTEDSNPAEMEAYIESYDANSAVLKTKNASQATLWRGVEKRADIPIPADGTMKINLLDGLSKSRDPRANGLRIVVANADQSRTIKLIGTNWKETSPDSARMWSDNYVSQSRYSFAPLGALASFNPYGKPADTEQITENNSRDNFAEAHLLSRTIFPVRYVRTPLDFMINQLGRPEAGPLSVNNVDRLMHPVLNYPKVVIGRVINIDGRPLQDQKITFRGKEFTSDRNGLTVLSLPSATNGDETFEVKATRYGVTDQFNLPAWRLTDLFARGNTDAVVFDIPLHLPDLPISPDVNLAKGKPVKDEKGSFPAQLVSLVDDSDVTGYSLAAGSWVEIDLGRDRLLGELELHGNVPSSFDVFVYGTADKIDAADRWISFDDIRKFERDYGVEHIYRPTANEARFVRIINRSKQSCNLSGIRISPAKQP
jgi:hypothetical protein